MNPLLLIPKWLYMARKHGVPKPEAFCLSTITRAGMPSSRMMLVTECLDGELIFCTDCRSNKGQNISDNPAAAALLYWQPISRQVRLEGTIEPAQDSLADADFNRKTAGQRLIISLGIQSSTLRRYRRLAFDVSDKLSVMADGAQLTRPWYWKAYRLRASRVEFFRGGSHRLNRRLSFLLDERGRWKAQRLYP